MQQRTAQSAIFSNLVQRRGEGGNEDVVNQNSLFTNILLYLRRRLPRGEIGDSSTKEEYDAQLRTYTFLTIETMIKR